MPTPKLSVGQQFYLQLLWTYLFGIFCASISITCGFLRNELVAHRGANDVVSCLSQFIMILDLKLAVQYLPDTARDMYIDLPAIESGKSEDSDSD